MPGAILTGEKLAEIERVLADLGRLFAEAGYRPVQPRHLFPADTLLDLYGEDVRARAFLFSDPAMGGELCLRPDFTVPVALAHAADGWKRPATYAYQGPVFRRQEAGAVRPEEYLQAGIESYGDEDVARADATVYALMLQGLDAVGIKARQATTGDLGIAFALLDALPLAAHQRRRLRRHFWRPAKFHALIEGFVAGPPAPSRARAALLAVADRPEAVADLAEAAGEVVGLRGLDEIAERAQALAREMAAAPMPREQADLIEAVLAVEGPSAACLARLRGLTAAAGVDIGATLDRFEARLEALDRVGIDAADLPFDADFGRNLEYYDGFVFEITAAGLPGLPPLAGGGRYDAITRRLGAGGTVPAVGAMIRPEAALAAARAKGGQG